MRLLCRSSVSKSRPKPINHFTIQKMFDSVHNYCRVYDRQNERKAEYEVYKLLANGTGPVDMIKLNSLSDRLISRANVTEEARRVVRQVKKQRPGFFWTIFRIAFEVRVILR